MNNVWSSRLYVVIEAELSVLSLSADVLCCHASIDIMQVDSSSGHVNSDFDLFRTKEIKSFSYWTSGFRPFSSSHLALLVIAAALSMFVVFTGRVRGERNAIGRVRLLFHSDVWTNWPWPWFLHVTALGQGIGRMVRGQSDFGPRATAVCFLVYFNVASLAHRSCIPSALLLRAFRLSVRHMLMSCMVRPTALNFSQTWLTTRIKRMRHPDIKFKASDTVKNT